MIKKKARLMENRWPGRKKGDFCMVMNENNAEFSVRTLYMEKSALFYVPVDTYLLFREAVAEQFFNSSLTFIT